MGKLTQEHLAPYLPFDLQIKGNTYGEIEILSGINGTSIYVQSQKSGGYGAWGDISDIKPILKPLSDLTSEIEHNGEKFIPSRVFGFELNRYNQEFLERKIKEERISWKELQKLFEWHFDVFGLIEQNLAVDYNKLKMPQIK